VFTCTRDELPCRIGQEDRLISLAEEALLEARLGLGSIGVLCEEGRTKAAQNQASALAHGAAWASVAHKDIRPKSSLDPHQYIHVVFSPARYSDLDVAAHIDQQGLLGHY
jgi:hypothetical protein